MVILSAFLQRLGLAFREHTLCWESCCFKIRRQSTGHVAWVLVPSASTSSLWASVSHFVSEGIEVVSLYSAGIFLQACPIGWFGYGGCPVVPHRWQVPSLTLSVPFPSQALYMFYALAIVCDDFFVPSLEKICEVHGRDLGPHSEAWEGTGGDRGHVACQCQAERDWQHSCSEIVRPVIPCHHGEASP